MPLRIATICVKGVTAKESEDPAVTTRDRLKWLDELAVHIDAHWNELDVVLLPGGFFYEDDYIGHRTHPQRVKMLNGLNRVTKAVRALARSPNVLIVAGVDGEGSDGDQLCVAWNRDAIAGIGRKIFPTREEADDLTCYKEDFSTQYRIITEPHSMTAVLCACYDGYAVAKRKKARDWRASVRYIAEHGPDPDHFVPVAADNVEELRQSFDALLNRARVALVSIHGFKRHSTWYWQKHGLNRAARALSGGRGFAYGAAHFKSGLPSAHDKSVLAAQLGKPKLPNDWFSLESKFGNALVRLFS